MRRNLNLNRVVFWTPSRLRMLVVCTCLVVGLLFVVSEYRNMNEPALFNPRLEPVEQSNHSTAPNSPEPSQPDWLQIQSELDLSPVGLEVERERSSLRGGADSLVDIEVETDTDTGNGQSERSVGRRAGEVSEPTIEDSAASIPRRVGEVPLPAAVKTNGDD